MCATSFLAIMLHGLLHDELTGIYDTDGDLVVDKTAVIRSENLRFDPADVINFLWYTAEGNTAMAAATAVAIIPLVGSVVAEGTKLGIKAGEKAAKKAAKKKLAKEAGKEAAEKGAKGGSSSNTGVGNPVKVEGRGSTGRTIPNNLGEQMAMHQVRSDPLEGATELPIKLIDTRWKSSDGWVKMQSVVETVDGNKITIHYVYNKVTGTFDDFKFK